jgi:adenylate kinase
MFGPTDAGKGTQAAALAWFCDVPHISTGDIFRANIQAETPMGKLAANALRAGELVPDSVTQAMLAERLHYPDTNDGFVLDGFPRTTDQATWLDAMLTGGSDVAAVIVLAAPDEVLLDRAQRREGGRHGHGDNSTTGHLPRTYQTITRVLWRFGDRDRRSTRHRACPRKHCQYHSSTYA